jgi:hypothetical protein
LYGVVLVHCALTVPLASMFAPSVLVDPKLMLATLTLQFAWTVAVTLNENPNEAPPLQLPGRVVAAFPLTCACVILE